MFLRAILLIVSAVTIMACVGSKARVIRGNVGGQVIDGQTGAVISGATVFSTNETSVTSTTEAAGQYFLRSLLSMRHTLRAEMAGYNSEDLSVYVPKEGTLSSANFVLLPTAYAQDKVIIVLTWGDQPSDLDSHLWVPDGSPYAEVFYGFTGDLTATPWASLDLDDVDAYGPETVAIKFAADTLDFAGIYRYYVHNFSVTPDITTSGAQVRVWLDGVLTKTYDVPLTGTGEYWHVFDLQNGVITDVNTISATPIANP